jgi:hypothetical protein
MLNLSQKSFFNTNDFDIGNEKFDESNTNAISNAQKKTESNIYYLISNSKQCESYLIKRDSYLKHMFEFTNDKTKVNQYMDELVY